MCFQAFNPTVSVRPSQQGKVTVQVKPVDPSIDAGAQVQQLVNCECIEDFTGKKLFWKNIDFLQSFQYT